MQLIDVPESSADQQLAFRREAERSRLARIQIGIQFLAQTRRGLGNIVEDQIAALDPRQRRGRNRGDERQCHQQQQINSIHDWYVLTRRG